MIWVLQNSLACQQPIVGHFEKT